MPWLVVMDIPLLLITGLIIPPPDANPTCLFHDLLVPGQEYHLQLRNLDFLRVLFVPSEGHFISTY